MAPLRFGLVGTSYWALHAHGTALAASPHADLRGVWGRDPVKAEELAQRLGAKSYTDFDQLLSEVDAVAFSVPPDIQADLAVRAARAGCHLVLEKPLALSVPGAEAVVGAVEEAGVAALVFFTSRFRPSTEQWTQEAVEARPWHSAHLIQYANIFQPGNPFSGSVWRRERGALWDVGPHALAGIMPVMGPVTSVAARRGPAESDTVHLVLTHGLEVDRAGRVAAVAGTVVAASTVSLSLTMPPAAISNQLVFYGERGAWARPGGGEGAGGGRRSAGPAGTGRARGGPARAELGQLRQEVGHKCVTGGAGPGGGARHRIEGLSPLLGRQGQ
jgi:predicted dehydrogenase